MSERGDCRNIALTAVLLGFATVLVFLPALTFNFTNYDDTYYVTENSAVRAGLTWHSLGWAFSNVNTGNWHPLTWVSHMLDVELYGVRPRGHHFTNVLLHAGSTVVLFLFLRVVTGAVWRSTAAAALFALHPLHVESVAWVAERKDVLSGLFGLLSLWAYAAYVREQARAQVPKARKHAALWYGASFGLLAFGLMSKPMLVTWPFVMLLLDYWPLGRLGTANEPDRRGKIRRLALEKVPFLALSVADSIVTLNAQASAGGVAPLEQVPFLQRLANAVVAYCQYIVKTFWPADLAVIYPQVRHWPLPDVAVAALVLASVSGFAWWQRKRRPYLLVGWLWFLGTLVPVIGLVQVGNQSWADRYMYLPSIGLLLMLCWGAVDVAGRYSHSTSPLRLAALACVCACAFVTRTQLAFWRNSETLFRHTLAVTQKNTVAWNSLGFYYAETGDPGQARKCFDAALAINPANPFTWSGLAKLSFEEGKTDEAIQASEQALRLNPKLAEAHSTLGQALMKQNRIADAVAQYSAAVALRPDSATAHYNYANALTRAAQLQQAIAEYDKALQLDPTSASAHSNLGYVLARVGKLQPAMLEFRRALELQPGFWQARFGLGDTLARLGDTQAAIQELTRLLHEKPDFAPAQQRLRQLIGTNTPAPEAK